MPGGQPKALAAEQQNLHWEQLPHQGPFIIPNTAGLKLEEQKVLKCLLKAPGDASGSSQCTNPAGKPPDPTWPVPASLGHSDGSSPPPTCSLASPWHNPCVYMDGNITLALSTTSKEFILGDFAAKSFGACRMRLSSRAEGTVLLPRWQRTMLREGWGDTHGCIKLSR